MSKPTVRLLGIGITKTALSILKMYRDLVKATPPNDTWVFNGEKQGYRDSLEAMKRAGLIAAYDLSETACITFPDTSVMRLADWVKMGTGE